MNRDDTIRMAREAGIVWNDHTVVGSSENLLERFAELVAAAEREECAKAVERSVLYVDGSHGLSDRDCHIVNCVTEHCVSAIRARGAP